MQHGFPTLVVREAVGDRARSPHEPNLFDIAAKYADVISLETQPYLTGVPSTPRCGTTAPGTDPKIERGPLMGAARTSSTCARELELCGVEEGETVAVLSQGDERADYADAFMAAPASWARPRTTSACPRPRRTRSTGRRRLDGRRDAAGRQPARPSMRSSRPTS